VETLAQLASRKRQAAAVTHAPVQDDESAFTGLAGRIVLWRISGRLHIEPALLQHVAIDRRDSGPRVCSPAAMWLVGNRQRDRTS
jgi:hypothetical protein